jgi:hypothetical protein
MAVACNLPSMTKSLIVVGTGRHTSALMAEGYSVKAVALVKRKNTHSSSFAQIIPPKEIAPIFTDRGHQLIFSTYVEKNEAIANIYIISYLDKFFREIKHFCQLIFRIG